MAKFFIDRPVFAWVIAIVLMMAGALSILKLPVSQYPNIAPPAIGIAVYAQGTSPRVNFQHIVTLAIDQPVVCGGVLVAPGDIVIADHDGVIVVPAAQAREVAQRARAMHETEERMQAAIRDGAGLVEAIRQYKIR